MKQQSPADALKATQRRAIALAERTGPARLRRMLERAQADLVRRLRETEGLAVPGGEPFTQARLRVTLAQVRDVLRTLKPGMKEVLLGGAREAAEKKAEETLRYLNRAERRFTGIAGALPIDEAGMLDAAASGSESSVLRRIATDPNHPGRPGVLDRYGESVIGDFEERLQTRFLARQSWGEVRDAVVGASDFLQGKPAHWGERIVRTELMNSNNRAGWESIRFAQKELGDVVKIVSSAFDSRTGCLLGDAVPRGVVRAVFRRAYEGNVIRLVTESGRDFATTPNHPMLTRRGWVHANALRLGDDLICDGRHEGAGTSGNENEAHRPSTIGEVFDALTLTGKAERRRTTHEEFHGDGLDGYVDVVRPDGLLRLGNFSPLNKPSMKEILSPSHDAKFCFECGSLLGVGAREDLDRLRVSADANSSFPKTSGDRALTGIEVFPDALERFASEVSIDDLVYRQIAASSGMSVTRELQPGGLRSGSAQSSFLELLGDVSAVGRHRCSNLGDREAAQIKTDRLVRIEFAAFHGHVFNLATHDGYFTVNGAFTANSDSYAVHGQIRRPSEAFASWFGLFQHPPDRPNDRGVVVPHRVAWPIPPELQPRSDGEVAARWSHEGRKGNPPARPNMSTVDRRIFGK